MGQAAAIFEMMRTLIGAGGDLSWGHAMSHMAGMSHGVVTGVGDGNHALSVQTLRCLSSEAFAFWFLSSPAHPITHQNCVSGTFGSEKGAISATLALMPSLYNTTSAILYPA